MSRSVPSTRSTSRAFWSTTGKCSPRCWLVSLLLFFWLDLRRSQRGWSSVSCRVYVRDYVWSCDGTLSSSRSHTTLTIWCCSHLWSLAPSARITLTLQVWWLGLWVLRLTYCLLFWLSVCLSGCSLYREQCSWRKPRCCHQISSRSKLSSRHRSSGRIARFWSEAFSVLTRPMHISFCSTHYG